MGRKILIAVLAALLTLSALAQVPPPPPGDDGPPPGGPGAFDRRETVRLFLVHKMRENLALSDAQTLKVLDALGAIDQERETSRQARRAAMERIQGLLSTPSSPDPAYRDAVAQFLKVQEQSEARMRDLDAKLLAALTPKQQAQFIVLRRELLENARQGAEGPRGNRRTPGRMRQ